ncbi:hypothetical protein ASC58_11330 [Phycicoccus sp. Root101]|nr:hypothetical protein ASC58_11330 [Phycicoccus sp. Root101]
MRPDDVAAFGRAHADADERLTAFSHVLTSIPLSRPRDQRTGSASSAHLGHGDRGLVPIRW